jgi:hypothetical protein
MGAWGGLCLFDEAALRARVEPALRAGVDAPLLQPFFDERTRYAVLAPALTAIAPGLRAPIAPWPATDTHEDLLHLFERVVTAHCIPQCVVFGRVVHRIGDLFPAELDWDACVTDALTQLDESARCWMHGSGGFGEGIHGWLSAESTELLALGLTQRPPEHAVRAAFLERWGDAERADLSVQLHRVALAWIDTAVERALGLLWGRDLNLFYADDDPRRQMARALAT